MIENGSEGRYSKLFIKRYREKFQIGQSVRVAKKENLKSCNKYEKVRFLQTGIIKTECNSDSYIIKLDDNGRLVKKRHDY